MYSEIILIGNELLIGRIQDTNGQYIIKKMLEYGHQISRITIIPDVLSVISETLLDALKRKPVFVFMSGGLGPTYDDMTFEGVANAFNVPLVLNEQALESLKIRYQKLREMGRTKNTELNDSRKKMAMIPENATPLHNSAGAAPGILIKHDNGTSITKIIAMPGFPDEMKAIFNDHVVPMISNLNSHYYHAGIIFLGVGESTLAEGEITLRKEYPEIWIKTHPTKASGDQIKNEIHLTTFIDSDDEQEIERLKCRLFDLRKKCIDLVHSFNGTIEEEY